MTPSERAERWVNRYEKYWLNKITLAKMAWLAGFRAGKVDGAAKQWFLGNMKGRSKEDLERFLEALKTNPLKNPDNI